MEQKLNKKIILKIILYVIFLSLNGYLFFINFVGVIPMLLLSPLYMNSKLNTLINNYFDITSFFTICSPFASYLLAKLFGMFKYIDDLKINIFKKLFLLTLISILSFLILFLRYRFFEGDNFAYKIASLIFSLIPAFGLYKYFQYLTKKYPNTFGKVGYYFSIECYKNLFKKLLSGINKRG